MEIIRIITSASMLISFCFVVSGNNVELNISNTIHAGEKISGSCSFIGKDQPKHISIKVKPSSCTIEGKTVPHEQLQHSNNANNFNITCSNSYNAINLTCYILITNKPLKIRKMIQIISEPKITSPPLNAIVTRPGLPITLSCEVDGDPNHYWVGWFYKTSMIQTTGDDDHSVSVSPSIRSLQGTTHHLTVHSVKQDGKYQCTVFAIKDGSVADKVTHEVAIANEEEDQLSSILDILPRLTTYT